MARTQEKQFGPGQSTITMSEAFERVLRMAKKGFTRGTEENRDMEAINLITALHVGTYNGGKK